MKIVECVQYSPEWWSARRGVPTASEFGSIMTPVKQRLASAAETYASRLVGDRLDLHYPRVNDYVSPAMRFGMEAEPESRHWFEMETGLEVRQVGFVLSDDGRFGCSPDGLCGDGLLELKNPQPDTQVRYLLAGVLPDEYLCQAHGQLIVTGLPWVWFLSYCPGLPPLLVKVEPSAVTDRLRAVLGEFWTLYDAMWRKIQGMRDGA